ncbi:DUF4838 domain-containing protein [Fulvivirgaceae bacterium BMA10]|uniref:DUF4838 domain-containing protein n=1 Tax=Splendidivirga corallicola TaxID=3051826 RepID=A0ABT8KN51_9BACT|nr:DUF4838 domain-containing protein [Fulvivirgaceae bacterium BMA10]
MQIILLFAVAMIAFFSTSCQQKEAQIAGTDIDLKAVKPVDKRGIVVYPSDLISLGAEQWVKMLVESGVNLLGIHTDTKLETLPGLKEYLESNQGRLLLQKCVEQGIAVEYELHVLQDILPRELYHEHPEYFRMDKNGKRQQKYNMCFTEEGAYKEIEKNILEITKWLKPTTHRYFFWTDDVQDAFCHSERCKPYSPSEQALIYENKLLEILRKVDPEAQVAHLAYLNTLEAPKKTRPLEGVFLEYAPINRNYSQALSDTHLKSLKQNLEVFPSNTAHVLEYWLDVSMFSGWDKTNLVQIPWNKRYCKRDVEMYNKLGINSITTFGAWINQDYLEAYGSEATIDIVKEYGDVLNNPEFRISLDADLSDWPPHPFIEELTAVWRDSISDSTVFDSKLTEEDFLFYFSTMDSTLTTVPFDKELSVAEGDRVELFFSANKDMSNYYCLEISPTGDILDYQAKHYRQFDEKWNFETIEVATSFLENRYIVEGRIALNELNKLGLGNEFNLGIFRADFKNEEEVVWYSWAIPDSKEPDFHIPSALKRYHLND